MEAIRDTLSDCQVQSGFIGQAKCADLGKLGGSGRETPRKHVCIEARNASNTRSVALYSHKRLSISHISNFIKSLSCVRRSGKEIQIDPCSTVITACIKRIPDEKGTEKFGNAFLN